MGLVLSLEKWVTYERYGRGLEKQLLTVPARGTMPMGYSAERPATDAEIAAAKRKRSERKQYAERQEAFEGRQEYKDAQAIASALELMDVNNNPLDRFTPDEWRELREKICGW